MIQPLLVGCLILSVALVGCVWLQARAVSRLTDALRSMASTIKDMSEAQERISKAALNRILAVQSDSAFAIVHDRENAEPQKPRRTVRVPL